MRGGLRAGDDHHGVGDYPSLGLRAPRDLHGVAVGLLHPERAEPHPRAAVPALVDLDVPQPRGGADPEPRLRVVALRGGPAGVDGVVTGGRYPDPEPRGGPVLPRPGVPEVLAVAGQPAVALLPGLRGVEAVRRGVVDDLRVGGWRFHDRKLPLRRPRRGVRPLRRCALRSRLRGQRVRPVIVELVVA